MSFGFGFGLPSWQTLSGGFTPASLFSAGEQGAWYDPSDYSTLFQDAAGTTPVTAVEQPVRLMLDKSKGLVLGPELVTNGDFSSGTTTGWTAVSGAVLSVELGKLKLMNGVANTAGADQSFTTVPGVTYVFTVTQSNGNSGTGAVLLGTALGGSTLYSNFAVSGTIKINFVATTTTTYLRLRTNSFTANDFVYFDDVSVKALPGNHATAPSDISRPILRARYNLLTYSEQFDNGVWSKRNSSTVTANSAIAPDGTQTADLYIPSATNSDKFVYQTITVSNGASYTESVYMKAGGYSYGYLKIQPSYSTPCYGVIVDLTNGSAATVVATGGATGSYTITSVGNGWYKVSVTVTMSATSYQWTFSPSPVASPTLNAYGDATFTGDGVSGVYVWGADLRPASQATGLIGPTYQRVAAATNYDTNGFLPYLQFDGIDDSMSTGSIDFTATDKVTVWAGVRKLSDAAQGVLTELSTASGGGQAFAVWAPAGATPTYQVRSMGTVDNNFIVSGFAAPITNVLTMVGNIGAPLLSLRVNGSLANSSTSTQGTGNYGNYPLFIGQRNNTSLPFNGWMSSLIIRGAQSTDSQISATESWVNQRTGAY